MKTARMSDERTATGGGQTTNGPTETPLAGTAASPVFGGSATNLGRLLLRDEGLLRVTLVDTARNQICWQQAAPVGRDLQVLENDRFLLGTERGYEERSTTTGEKLREETAFPGTVAAYRLPSGNTLLSRIATAAERGIELIEVGAAGKSVREIAFPGFGYVRLIRPTPTGTFLITSNTQVFEGTGDGRIVWRDD